MISTFKRNRHFRKALVNKTFTRVQKRKKAMSPQHFVYILPSVKSTLNAKISGVTKIVILGVNVQIVILS